MQRAAVRPRLHAAAAVHKRRQAATATSGPRRWSICCAHPPYRVPESQYSSMQASKETCAATPPRTLPEGPSSSALRLAENIVVCPVIRDGVDGLSGAAQRQQIYACARRADASWAGFANGTDRSTVQAQTARQLSTSAGDGLGPQHDGAPWTAGLPLKWTLVQPAMHYRRARLSGGSKQQMCCG